jgi:isopentenyldiphosphate isomerase
MKNKDEMIDLYDVNRLPLNQTMIRGTKVPQDCYRMVVHIILIKNNNQMVIQKRVKDKTFGGLWDFSCGGSSQTKETSQMAAQRELEEELGLKIDFSKLRPAFTINFENGFDDFYLIPITENNIAFTLQKEEVEEVKIVTKEEIILMIRNGLFIPYKESIVNLIFDSQMEGGCHQKKSYQTKVW